MPAPIEDIQFILTHRQVLENGEPNGALNAYYDDADVSHASTYIHVQDMQLLTLAMKSALGITQVDAVENFTPRFYLVENDGLLFEKPTTPEIKRLSTQSDNTKLAETFKKAIHLLSPEKNRVSFIISSSALNNDQGRVHFLNMNFERLTNGKIQIDIDDGFGAILQSLDAETFHAYETRLRELLTGLLGNINIERIRLTPLEIAQDEADCGIHALINKINFEHHLSLNPKNCVAPLRAAIAASYQNLNNPGALAKNLVARMSALGLKPQSVTTAARVKPPSLELTPGIPNPTPEPPKPEIPVSPGAPGPEIPRPSDPTPEIPGPDLPQPEIPNPPQPIDKMARAPKVIPSYGAPARQKSVQSGVWESIKQFFARFKAFWGNLLNKIFHISKLSKSNKGGTAAPLPPLATLPQDKSVSKAIIPPPTKEPSNALGTKKPLKK